MLIVDLYPFEETVKSGLGEEEIIEKIDIGGISLIRAAAKNYNDVTVLSKKEHYNELSKIIYSKGKHHQHLQQRKYFATESFSVSNNYDTAIHDYFNSVK